MENKTAWHKERLKALVDCIEGERELLLLFRFARALIGKEVRRHG